KPPLACGSGDGSNHFVRQVDGHDPLRLARHQIGNVAATRAKIECASRSRISNNGIKRIEICTLRMDRAVDIRFCTRAKFGYDRLLMCSDTQAIFNVSKDGGARPTQVCVSSSPPKKESAMTSR